MRFPALVLAVVAVTPLLAPAGPRDKDNPPPKDAAEASAKKIKELQKERIATLKTVAEISLKLAQAARLETWEALEAQMALLKAEVDAAETDSEKVALYTKALDSLKTLEALGKAQFQAGRATELAVHKVKARRLEVEIDLERAKARQAKAGK
jgi:DNA uptake protein ComE-like DNA-binding protein